MSQIAMELVEQDAPRIYGLPSLTTATIFDARYDQVCGDKVGFTVSIRLTGGRITEGYAFVALERVLKTALT
ncbi:hypothetical protein [Tsukamurella soli]|uniref:Uncharacterized protein n=1 Tax=Tsukamurella soli TaxID=644556 RepID=A0ABP8JJ01_9ACTN